MLTELVVEGLGVIARAELEFGAGASVLTGETGAGKTLVVAALGLLAGDRSDRGLVRDSATEARVEARFVVPSDHAAVSALCSLGLPQPTEEDVEILVSRTLQGDGRSGRVRINGRLATVGSLAEVGGALVEIAGQHAARTVGVPAQQRLLLDSYAGEEALQAADELGATVRGLAALEREMQELDSTQRARERELDVVRYEISEISKAELREGELAQLTADAARLEHAESLALSLGAAAEALRGDGGAQDLIGRAEGEVAAAVSRDPALGHLLERLAAVGIEVADVATDLIRSLVTPDPAALEAIQQRLATLGRLRRKYGDDEAQILGYLERAAARALELEGSDAAAAHLQQELDRCRGEAHALAARLTALRVAAAPRLGEVMERMLAELALPESRFEVRLVERELFEGGAEAVVFHVSTNPGEAPRPLAKVASGGELSRIALALHLLASSPEDRTMVFDEVDAGVGGRAAQSVGRALARLARARGIQVLVVTHLPQVAAFADAHYLVQKEQYAGRTDAVVTRLADGERVDELSRMLAGMPESERAREHAQELLDIAAEMVEPVGGRL